MHCKWTWLLTRVCVSTLHDVYFQSHPQIIPVIHVEYEFIYRLPCIVLLFIVCKTVEKWHKLTACCSKLTSLKSSRIDPELSAYYSAWCTPDASVRCIHRDLYRTNTGVREENSQRKSGALAGLIPSHHRTNTGASPARRLTEKSQMPFFLVVVVVDSSSSSRKWRHC